MKNIHQQRKIWVTINRTHKNSFFAENIQLPGTCFITTPTFLLTEGESKRPSSDSLSKILDTDAWKLSIPTCMRV